ncbi:hypothetical protein NQ317_011728 [Molorchus minor]|uniref:non-specific serine/threonine protein kinase n=1 Tax=Molorchus minor TaxID=1323400 RepID=A0ABQ9JB17_9CUCU|nr:hypothetical protein NQ317_011728 [Molorchus minor]
MNENNSVANIDYNKIEEESLVHVTETPKTIVDGECKIDSTLIDLTVSVDECQPHKISEELKIQPIEIDKSVDEGKTILQTSELSDIIESSIQEISQVDSHSFKIPLAGNVRKRHSKTMLLKAGKLWRRSLAIHKRSNLMLSYVNVPPCKVGDGSLCICSMCTVSKETTKRLSHRRCSIRIVPAYPVIDPSKETSILESYAHSASYVSDQIFDDNLEDNLRSLSLSQRGSFIQDPAPVTARELVLRRCGQTEPILFEECYPKSVLQHCQKIGEGVYGEVFLFRNPNGGTSVIKVIPIEGDQIVNGERQKKFEEIFSEIIIAQELSNLRNNKQNMTSGFSEVQKVQCVQGRYPEKLLDLWDLYDETRGSENDSPEIFDHNQLYIVLQLANGGQDLEAFIFTNASQAFSMFQQVACALAIAEEHMHFEHRDLHWGNVLLSDADRNKKINFRLDGKNYEIMAKGIEVAIIDFTLSRIEHDGVVIFNDLSLDPDLFTAEGDYQFEIYKLMQQKNGNNWQRFEPYSNVLWLHYILDKAITALRYKNVQTKVHKEYIAKLKQLKNDIFKYSSVKEFVLNNF